MVKKAHIVKKKAKEILLNAQKIKRCRFLKFPS